MCTSNNLFQLIEIVIIFISVIAAFLTYFYQKKKDNELLAIDILSFFRREIIKEEEKYTTLIKENIGEDYNIPLLRIESLDLKNILKEYGDEIIEQYYIFYKINNFVLELSILNKLEEVALKVDYFNLLDSKIIFSIKEAFVRIVETHGYALLFARGFEEKSNSYLNIIKIYNIWKEQVDRKSNEERLDNFIKLLNGIGK